MVVRNQKFLKTALCQRSSLKQCRNDRSGQDDPKEGGNAVLKQIFGQDSLNASIVHSAFSTQDNVEGVLHRDSAAMR